MKITFIGVQHMRGTSAKTGNQYDFAKLMYAADIQPVNKEHCQITGYGSEVRDLSLDSRAIDEFFECRIGDVIDVRVEPDPRNLSKNQCTGITA